MNWMVLITYFWLWSSGFRSCILSKWFSVLQVWAKNHWMFWKSALHSIGHYKCNFKNIYFLHQNGSCLGLSWPKISLQKNLQGHHLNCLRTHWWRQISTWPEILQSAYSLTHQPLKKSSVTLLSVCINRMGIQAVKIETHCWTKKKIFAAGKKKWSWA